MAHNKVDPSWPETLVDSKFLANWHAQQHKPYIPEDPRQHHGIDHAVRTTVFASIFGYLYAKYHPKGGEITNDHICLSQMTVAGHDSGRQTEGPDIYDELSAKYTENVLREEGITDEGQLKDAFKAVAEKDASPTSQESKKSFVGKFVQCADCADFARLLLHDSPVQDESRFQESLKYLDIYKEMQEIARQSVSSDKLESAVLRKHADVELTYNDFLKELQTIKKEMNLLIYQTHQLEARQQLAQSQDPYQALLEQINPISYPALCHALRQVGVKKNPPKPDKEALEIQDLLTELQSSEPHLMSLDKLQRIVNWCKNQPKNDDNAHWLSLAENLIQAKTSKNKHAATRVKYLKFLQQEINTLTQYLELDPKSLSIALAGSNFRAQAQMHNIVKSKPKLEQLENKWKSIHDHASVLKALEERIRELEKESTLLANPEERLLIHTTIASSIQKTSLILIRKGNIDEAQRWLRLGQELVTLGPTHPLRHIDSILENKGQFFLSLDTDVVRRRCVRISKKEIQGKKYYELSFDIRSKYRKELNRLLRVLNLKIKPTVYRDKDRQLPVTYAGQAAESLSLTGASGAEVQIGNTPYIYALYNQVKVTWPEDAFVDDVQNLLCQIGLPSALMASRNVDIENEARARVLALRAPNRVYKGSTAKEEAEETLSSLLADSKERQQIEEDVQACKVQLIGHNGIETIHPKLPQEAWNGGIRSIGSFLSPSTPQVTAQMLVNILRSGLLSSQERFERGIFGFGCCPYYNMATGSSNQVFTRAISQKMIDDRINLVNSFAVCSSVMMIMDVKLFERIPYFYLEDRGGLRNADYYQALFTPQKQAPIPNYKGHERLQDRPSFEKFMEELNKQNWLLNEVMFEGRIPPEYFRRIIVTDENYRGQLLRELGKLGVTDFNGVPITEFIVCSQELNDYAIGAKPATDENP